MRMEELKVEARSGHSCLYIPTTGQYERMVESVPFPLRFGPQREPSIRRTWHESHDRLGYAATLIRFRKHKLMGQQMGSEHRKRAK